MSVARDVARGANASHTHERLIDEMVVTSMATDACVRAETGQGRPVRTFPSAFQHARSASSVQRRQRADLSVSAAS